MPPMILRKDLARIAHALASQQRTGRPSLRLTNRCVQLSAAPALPTNRNMGVIPKPMTQDDVSAVVKKTGFTPFIETKFVRRGRR